MKKILFALAIALGLGCQQSAKAQTTIVIQGNQPDWGPYSYSQASFYYIPAMNVYYDIANRLFYYLSGNAWISARALPNAYRHYDLYTVYKQPISGSRPWLRNATHRGTYGKNYQNRSLQLTFRDRKNNLSHAPSSGSHRGNGNVQNNNRPQNNSGNVRPNTTTPNRGTSGRSNASRGSSRR